MKTTNALRRTRVHRNRRDSNSLAKRLSIECLEDRRLLAFVGPTIDLASLGDRGFVINGSTANGIAGYSVGPAGDLNNDGFADVVVGAHNATVGSRSQTGESYVVFGAPTPATTPGSGSVPILDTRVFASTGNTYHLLAASTWTDAQQTAEALGGNLVTINDAAEEDWVWTTLKPAEVQYLWIGLHDSDGDGTFAWVSGEPVTYTNWQPGQPSGGPNNPQGEIYAQMGYGDARNWNDAWDDLYLGDIYGVVEVSGTYGVAPVVEAGLLNGVDGFRIRGEETFDRSGFSVRTAGDVNGDGVDDVLIGSFDTAATGGVDKVGQAYVVFGQTPPAPTTHLQVHDASFEVRTRTTAARFLPILADTDGTIYGVPSMSVFALLTRITPSGARQFLSAVDAVIGTGADMVFGFDGDIFANSGVVGTSPNGVVRMNRTTGDSTPFWNVSDTDRADGGLVFDAAANVMYVISSTSPTLYALDSGGNSTVVISNVAGNVISMTQDHNGKLLALDTSGRIYRIDPVAGTSTLYLDLGSEIPTFSQFRSIAYDPVARDIWFTLIDNPPAGEVRSLYRMNHDGSDLTLIATGKNLLNVSIGGRSDGIGGTAIYVSSPVGVTAGSSLPDNIFELRPRATVDLASLDGTNGFEIRGQNAFDLAGRSVSDAGDINGDGFADFIVAAPEASPNGNIRAGQAYVVFGRDAGFPALMTPSMLDGTNGFVVNGSATGDYAGIAVSSAGDFNGDGFDDVLIGAYKADPAGRNQAGRTYVVFGKGSGFAPQLNLSALDGTNGFVLNGVGAGDFAGRAVGHAGDVNGDGIDDIIIGASDRPGPLGARYGEAYVVFGHSGPFAAQQELSALDGANGFALMGIDPADRAGRSVDGAGDVNGDGFDDVIIGAVRGDPQGRMDAGEAYLVFGKPSGFVAKRSLDGLDGVDGITIEGAVAGELGGFSVAGAGDINGDGFDDVIFGAYYADPNGVTNAGRAYVVYGQNFNALQINELAIDAGAEGAETSLSLEFENYGRAHVVTVDWGDGQTETLPRSSSQNTLEVGHIYADNGDYMVGVRIVDAMNSARAVDETRVASVANVAPNVSPLAWHVTPYEGSVAEFQLLISDPGFDNPLNPAGPTTEAFSYQVDWGDGTPIETGPIAISDPGGPGMATQAILDLSHVYANDIDGEFQVVVTVSDDDGGTVQRTYTADVLNLPPDLELTGPASVQEGQLFTIGGAFTDPSFYNPLAQGGPTQESYFYTIDWGDGTPTENGTPDSVVPGSPGMPTSGSFSRGHHYADDGTYTVTVSISDDDGGSDERTHMVAVTNASPQLVVGADQTSVQGQLLSLVDLGVFTDPGFDNPLNPGSEKEETFSYSIDWGDGSPVESGTPTIDVAGEAAQPTQGSFDGSHIYFAVGTHTVTVTVSDDDGGVSTATFLVDISSAPPILSVIPDIADWTRQLGTDASDQSYGVSADTLGSVYISGSTTGSLGGPFAGDLDAFVSKYSTSGILQWTHQLGTAAAEYSNGVSADGLGNVFIAGFTRGALDGPNAGQADAFVSKYDAFGVLQWTRQFGTNAIDSSTGVSADGLGNVYITGFTDGAIDGPNAGERDVFLAKYDASGVLQWTRQLGTNARDESYGVSADGQGNVYISGRTTGSLGSPNAGGEDAFVSKYDASGNLHWTRQLGTTADDNSFGVSADRQGNVYISGRTMGSLGSPNAGDNDAFISKYDASGNLQWTRQLGTSGREWTNGVSADVGGDIYISGHTEGSLNGPNAGGLDAFVSKFSASGILQWTRQLGTAEVDYGTGVSADGRGNAYISGYTAGSLGGANTGNADAFLLKYAIGLTAPFEGANFVIADVGAFTDYDPGDYIFQIDWGDSTIVDSGLATIDIAGGGGTLVQGSFDGSHTYADHGIYTVTATITDPYGESSSDSFEITVENAEPTTTINGAATIDEGAAYELTVGNVVDPGDDTVSEWRIDWGDGSPVDVYSSPPGTVSHVFADGPAHHTISISLVDEDGTYDAVATHSVSVMNVAPTVDLGQNAIIDAGMPFLRVGSFADPGSDTWTAEVDYGDGSGFVPLVPTADKRLILNVTYPTPGLRTVQVRVSDDDGGVGVDFFTIDVRSGPPTLTLDPDVAQGWIRQFGSSANDEMRAMAVDHDGNVYMAGYTQGDVAGENLGSNDVILSKHDPNGNRLWLIQFGTAEGDVARGVAVDADGNEFVSGDTIGSLGGPNAGETDAFLSKYDTDGNLLWSRQLGSSALDVNRGLALDDQGNAYITGGTQGDLAETNLGGLDAYIAKYDGAGNRLWTRQLGTTGDNDSFLSVAVDVTGNVYASGVTNGDLAAPNAGLLDAFLTRYTGDGDLVWSRQMGTSADEIGHSVAVDANGNVYTSGATGGSLAGPSAGDSDVHINKFDPQGMLLWSRQIGTSATEQSRSIDVDADGNVVVTGLTLGSLGGENAGSYDIFLARYDTDGNATGRRQFGTANGDIPWDVVFDGSGNIFVNGVTQGNLGATHAGGWDVLLAKLSSTSVATEGTPLVAIDLGTFTDYDVGNYTYSIEWGDGTSADSGVATIDVSSGGPNTLQQGSFDGTHTYADDGQYRVAVTLTDPTGRTSVASFFATVANVAPTVALSGGGQVDEGDAYALSVGPVNDIGADSVTQWRIDWDDGSPVEVFTSAPGVVQHTFADGPTQRNVSITLVDEDGVHGAVAPHVVSVLNVEPIVDAGEGVTIDVGETLVRSGAFVDPGDDSWTAEVDYGDGAGFVPLSLTTEKQFTFDVRYATPGTRTVTVRVTDDDGGMGADSFQVTVEPTFLVSSFTPNATGYVVAFSRPADTSLVNLYDGPDVAVEPADVTLVGDSVGTVAGSWVWNAAGDEATFIKTGDPLAADTYTVTLFSRATGFADALGNLLDGDGDSTPGDDFVDTFTIASTTGRVVSLSDFARGPAQAVNVPNTATGLPIRISDGSGVLSLDLDIVYDPALLDISAITRGSGAPPNWTVTANLSQPGRARVTASGITALAAGPVDVLKVAATVSGGAPMGAAQVVRLENVRVNGGLIASVADAALQKVAFLADVDGNFAFTAFDAAFISRVVVGLDTGFDAFPLIDPVVIGNSSATGSLSGLDAAYVAQKAVFLPRPEIPDLPPNLPAPSPTAPDPAIGIPAAIFAQAGSAAHVPVTIDNVEGLLGATWRVNYETVSLDLADERVTLGDELEAAGWNLVQNVDDAGGVAYFAAFTAQPGAAGPATLLDMHFHSLASAVGTTSLDLSGPASDGGFAFTYVDGTLTLTTAGDVNVDGAVSLADVVALQRNFGKLADAVWTDGDLDGDGDVDRADLAIVAANLGRLPTPTPPPIAAEAVVTAATRSSNLVARRRAVSPRSVDVALADSTADISPVMQLRALRRGRRTDFN